MTAGVVLSYVKLQAGVLCNVGHPSETHLKTKSREISFAHNLFLIYPIVWCFISQLPNRVWILYRAQRWYCRALYKISYRLDKWKKKDKWDSWELSLRGVEDGYPAYCTAPWSGDASRMDINSHGAHLVCLEFQTGRLLNFPRTIYVRIYSWFGVSWFAGFITCVLSGFAWLFTHDDQGCIIGTGTIARLVQYQWVTLKNLSTIALW